MTLHFIHVGKTGGTAVKWRLKRSGLAYWSESDGHQAPETPYGRILLHKHTFRMHDVPPGDYVFFCVRDPIDRFVSGFHSRLNKGQPRYNKEWTIGEREAFEAFPTPQRLAAALAGDDHDERLLAESAMRHIRHLGFMDRKVGTPRQLRARIGQIAYIARQETLDTDWAQLTSLLGLPRDLKLPSGQVRAHRGVASRDTTLDDNAVKALRDWYARDYRLVSYCDQLRAWRGWGTGPGSPAGAAGRFRHEVMRFRGIPAILPAPPPGLRRRLPF